MNFTDFFDVISNEFDQKLKMVMKSTPKPEEQFWRGGCATKSTERSTERYVSPIKLSRGAAAILG